MRTRRSEPSSLEALPMGPKHRPVKIPVLENAGDQSASRLLSLTPELRNHIYEMCFDGIRRIPTYTSKDRKGRMSTPGLLLACKQIYAEALKIYYNKTEFRCGSPSRLTDFLRRVVLKGGHGGDLSCVTLDALAQVTRRGCPRGRTVEHAVIMSFEKLMAMLDDGSIVERANIRPGVVNFKYLVSPQENQRVLETMRFRTWTVTGSEGLVQRVITV